MNTMNTRASLVSLLENILLDVSPQELEKALTQRAQEFRDFKGGFYNRTLEAKGQEAAENQLTEYITSGRVLSSYIPAIVQGIKDITETDLVACERVKYYGDMGNRYDSKQQPPWLFTQVGLLRSINGGLVVVHNPKQNGFGSRQVLNSHVWGADGSLGMIALVLSVDSGYFKRFLSATLVFKHRNNDAGVITWTIEKDGHSSCTAFVPNVDRFLFLDCLLGAEKIDTVPFFLTGAPLDTNFKFPGAEDFILKHIGELGPYLSEVAENISRKG